MGQDAEISKLTDGGGSWERDPGAFFLLRLVLGQNVYHRPFFLKDRCKRLAERGGEIEIPTRGEEPPPHVPGLFDTGTACPGERYQQRSVASLKGVAVTLPFRAAPEQTGWLKGTMPPA